MFFIYFFKIILVKSRDLLKIIDQDHQVAPTNPCRLGIFSQELCLSIFYVLIKNDGVLIKHPEKIIFFLVSIQNLYESLIKNKMNYKKQTNLKLH